MTSGGTSRSIAERLDPRDNALNLLRLVLAGLVIVSHARPLGGFGGDPQLGDLKLGSLAVGGFFAISGYLITGSRRRSNLSSYLWRRFLRIMPGLWVCVLFTAFVAAGVVGVARGGWSLGEAGAFAASKAAMLESHQGVGTTLAAVPFPEAWNAPLWTIRYELACYLLAGVAGGLTVFWARRWLTVAVFVAATAVSAVAAVQGLGLDGTAPGKAAYLLPFFLAGVVLLQYRDRVPLTGPLAVVAAVALGAEAATGTLRVLAPLPVAYLLLWLAVALPAQLRAVGSRNDLSYGVYLYGWPVQQLLVVAGARELGLTGYTVACLVAVVPLAAASWFLVERPAMRWKDAVGADRTSWVRPPRLATTP